MLEGSSAAAQSSSRLGRFQVLALDGGGIRGIFSAAILAALEEHHGGSILDRFDLVTGTSTGGLIALALGAGRRPAEIVSAYQSLGSDVFSGHRWREKFVRPFRPKYSQARLREVLERQLLHKTLHDSIVRLVIPAYNLTTNQPRLFKTPHHPRLYADWKLEMIEVGLATSAAPTYFRARSVDNARFIDGGVWANNPVIVGIAEAVSMFEGVALTDVRVLSIGTTSHIAHRPHSLDRGGWWQWKTAAVDVILNGQSKSANNGAHHLLGEGERLLRVDETVAKDLARLDHADVEELLGCASTVAMHVSPRFESLFEGHTPRPYVPLH